MENPKNKKQTTEQLEQQLEQQAIKIAELEKGQAIEAALERVRARTMAMHKSAELSEVATVMFKEFQQLQLINEIARIGININDEENGDCTMWLTRLGGEELSATFEYNYLDNELWEAEYRAYQKVTKHKRKEHKYIVTHEGEGWERLLIFGLEKEILTTEEVAMIRGLGIQKWMEHIVQACSINFCFC